MSVLLDITKDKYTLLDIISNSLIIFRIKIRQCTYKAVPCFQPMDQTLWILNLAGLKKDPNSFLMLLEAMILL
jgi:hypothetical protein